MSLMLSSCSTWWSKLAQTRSTTSQLNPKLPIASMHQCPHLTSIRVRYGWFARAFARSASNQRPLCSTHQPLKCTVTIAQVIATLASMRALPSSLCLPTPSAKSPPTTSAATSPESSISVSPQPSLLTTNHRYVGSISWRKRWSSMRYGRSKHTVAAVWKW